MKEVLNKGYENALLLVTKAINKIMLGGQDITQDDLVLAFTAASQKERLFCECCGMRLRASLANREFKEKVRAKKKLNLC
jgi:hypothetical protein